MAASLKDRAIVAVCDISKNEGLANRLRAASGTIIFFRRGMEIARAAPGEDASDLQREISALGVNVPM